MATLFNKQISKDSKSISKDVKNKHTQISKDSKSISKDVKNKHTQIAKNSNNATGSQKQLPVCKAGHNCQYKTLVNHKAIHPEDDQIVVKNPDTNQYEIAYPIDAKCPQGINCLCFDIIQFVDNKTGKDTTKKITKCRYTKGHVACRGNTKCKNRLNCEFYHTPEEENLFCILNEDEERKTREAETVRIEEERKTREAELLRIEEEKRQRLLDEEKAANDWWKYCKEDKCVLEQRKEWLLEDVKSEKPVNENVGIPKTIHKQVTRSKVSKPITKPIVKPVEKSMKIELPKEARSYLLVEVEKQLSMGGFKAKVIGEVSGIGNVKTTEVEVIPYSFAESEYVGKILNIQGIYIPSIKSKKGNKFNRLGNLLDKAIGNKFVAQFGSNDKSCELLDVVKYNIVVKMIDDEVIFEDSEEFEGVDLPEGIDNINMEPETIDDL
jgi:hypothetical protein